jgi:transcriptional regulator with XRE-family HTH domain
MSPKQCRAARALLRWSTLQLAERAGVPLQTVLDFQAGRHIPSANNLQAIRRAIEDAGIHLYRRADTEWVSPEPGVVDRATRHAAGR